MNVATKPIKPLSFLAMKGVLEKIGKKGSEYIIKWEDINLDFRQNLRVDYGDLSDLDSLADGMIQPIIGYIGEDNKVYPVDGFRRLANIKGMLEQGLEPPEIKFSLDQSTATTLGRLKLILNSATAKPLSLVEQGRGYQLLRDECNMDNLAISKLSFKTAAHIGQCLTLVDNASSEVISMIEDGHIASSEVIKLHQSLSPEEADTLIHEVVEKAKGEGVKATGKVIREAKEKKAKVEDTPSQFSNEDKDEFAEHLEIAQYLGMMSLEDWKQLDIGPLRKVLKMVNN